MPRHKIITGARAAGVGLAALTVTAATAAPAGAHVTVSTDHAAAGAYAVLAFSVPHGCDGSSTTEVSIEIPEGINAVTPTRAARWQVDTVTADLDEPVEDSHGNRVTERVAEVVYTADDPLPDGQRDVFELSLQLPEESAGTTLHFPTVQTCTEGESAWVQVPAAGQDPDELELPAPAVEVGAAADGDSGSGAQAEQSAEPGAGSGAAPWAIGALGLSGAALVVAVLALLRGRPRA